MLKKKAINRILITTVIFFLVFIMYTLKGIDYKKEEKSSKIDDDISYIYTLTDDNYLSKMSVYVNKDLSLEDKVKEKLEIMIKENNKNSLLPSYFNPILPKNTRIEDVKIEDSLVKLYFSKELLNINEKQSETMIEAITYSITDENILGIEIYVEGEMLKYVPHQKKELPSVLTKDFGINKTYEISKMDNIVKIVMMYYSEDDGKYYETPVTKYVNEDREKLEIILNNFETMVKESNIVTLMDDVEILDYEITNNEIKVNLNKSLSVDEENIFLQTIFNNYDVLKITLLTNNEKKSEKTLKDIEK